MLELNGVITQHVVDAQRGTGVDLKLEPLPTKTVWLIESALAAENKVRAATAGGAEAPAPADSTEAISDGADVAAAETELIRALEAEAESLRKLNPFLVLGVGYEASDGDVRAAFGELTKRYHPDRFARYQSSQLRQIASEIFIVIRDAYRKLADEESRGQVRQTLGAKVTPRAQSQPRPAPVPSQRPTGGIAKIAVPRGITPKPPANDAPTMQGPHDAPTNPSAKSAVIASTDPREARPGTPSRRPTSRMSQRAAPRAHAGAAERSRCRSPIRAAHPHIRSSSRATRVPSTC